MTKITTTVQRINDETGDVIKESAYVSTYPEGWESGDGTEEHAVMHSGEDDKCDICLENDCYQCEFSDACLEDSSESDSDGAENDDVIPYRVIEVTINPYELIAKALSLVALGLSAASAIKLWKKVR